MTVITTDTYRIYCGDNAEYYDSVGGVQAVITDPPYDSEVHSQERVARDEHGMVEAVPVPFESLTSGDVHGLGRFCNGKLDGWALIFCQTEQINAWRTPLEVYGLRYFRPMLWIKPDAKPNLRGHGPGIGHETIAAFWKSSRKQCWNGGGKVGVFYHTRARRDGSRHPTEKPVSLMKELVRYFTNPGDTVFDPFMGAGTTGVAALELGRKFIGIERSREYFDEAKRRLEEAARPELVFEPDTKPATLFGDAAFGSKGTRKRLQREAKEREEASNA